MILQTNINDKLYKELSSSFQPSEMDKVINEAVANYLEEKSEQHDCSIALERKNNQEEILTMEQVFGHLDVDNSI